MQELIAYLWRNYSKLKMLPKFTNQVYSLFSFKPPYFFPKIAEQFCGRAYHLHMVDPFSSPVLQVTPPHKRPFHHETKSGNNQTTH